MAVPDLTKMSQIDLENYLSSLPPDQGQIMDLLRGQFGNIGQITPLQNDQPFGDRSDPNYFQQYTAPGLGTFGDLRPNANGGFSGYISPPFDSRQEGGTFGRYRGNYSADGVLDPASVNFVQEQRDDMGWLGNHVPELAAAASLAIAGGAGGFFGGESLGGVGGVAGSGAPAGFSGAASGAGAAGGGIDAALAGAGGTGFSGASGAGLAGSVDLAGLGLGGTGTFGELTGATMLTGGGVAPALTTGAGGVTAGLGAAGAAAGAGGAGSALGSIVDSLGGTKGLAGLAGAAAGALGGGPDESTTSRNVPEWAQPYAQDITKRGQDIANTPFQPYTGQRFAGPNDATKQSWEMANQFANAGPSAAQQISQGTFNRLQSGTAPDFGNAERISNQYIGQTTPGAGNQYIGQNANSNVSGVLGGANPYTNQTTGSIGPLGQMSLAQTQTDVGRNALLGQNNPYLNDAIGFATGDITRNFNNTINPNLDRMARASGSFGNTGVEQAREEANRTLAQQIGRTTNDMRMADYNLQAQLGEGDLGRRTNAALTDAQRNLGASQAQQQFNIGNDLSRQQANLGYRAADLGRSSTGFDAAQGRMLDAAKFDATNAQNNWQTNLAATSDLSKYNAGLAQTDLARNAGLQSTQQQFNAGQGNFDITGARNDWNSAEGRAAQTMGAYQGYDQAAVNRAALLGTTGASMNTYAQQPLDFQNQEFMRQQQYPAQQLGVYQNAYNTGVNGQSVQSTPTGGNTAAQVLGGAATGIGLWNMFNQPQQQQNTNYQFDPITGRRYA